MKKTKKSYKKDFDNILEYIILTYYMNPKHLFAKKEIMTNLNIKNYLVVNEIIDTLKKYKYLKQYTFTSDKFKISYDGIIYLQEKRNNKYSNQTAAIALIIALITLFDDVIIPPIINVIKYHHPLFIENIEHIIHYVICLFILSIVYFMFKYAEDN